MIGVLVPHGLLGEPIKDALDQHAQRLRPDVTFSRALLPHGVDQ